MIRQIKTIQTFPPQISSRHSPCIELYEFRFKALFIVAVCNFAIALWLIFKGSSGLWQLIRRSIGTGMQWCKEWRRGLRFLNMLYKIFSI